MTAPAGTAGDRVRSVVRGLGQLLITAGVVVLLFCVYELKVTGVYTAREQDTLDKELTQQWAGPARTTRLPSGSLGKGIARIYLPTLGHKAVHVVVEGTSHADLKKGPGHIVDTALPGQVGNAVVSGHRTTYGAPFNRLDELRAGDAIVLETRTSFFTYSVQRSYVVSPSAVEVTFPVPGRKGVAPTQRLLTLTTCNPKYSARTRLVVQAVLTSTLARTPGAVPPALQGF